MLAEELSAAGELLSEVLAALEGGSVAQLPTADATFGGYYRYDDAARSQGVATVYGQLEAVFSVSSALGQRAGASFAADAASAGPALAHASAPYPLADALHRSAVSFLRRRHTHCTALHCTTHHVGP